MNKAAKNFIRTTALSDVPLLANCDDLQDVDWLMLEEWMEENAMAFPNPIGLLYEIFLWLDSNIGTEWIADVAQLPLVDKQALIEAMRIKLIGNELEEDL